MKGKGKGMGERGREVAEVAEVSTFPAVAP
jgi:hypothetical protein